MLAAFFFCAKFVQFTMHYSMPKLPIGMLFFFLILAFMQPFHGYVINLYSSSLACLAVLVAVASLCISAKSSLSFGPKSVLLLLGFLLLVGQSAIAGADLQDLNGFIIYASCIVLLSFVLENDEHTILKQGEYYQGIAIVLLGAGILISLESFLLDFDLFPGINFRSSTRLLGPMGQPNLLGVFIAISFMALNYVTLTFPRKQAIWTALAVSFGFVMASTASRAGYLMEMGSALVCVLLCIRGSLGKHILLNYLGLLLGHIIFYCSQLLVNTSTSSITGSLMQRDFVSIRGIELHKAIQVFKDHPFGVGFGRYNEFSQWMKLNVKDPRMNTPELVTHCHNLFGQVAAEFGVIGLTLLAIFIVVLLRGFYRIYQESKAVFFFTFSCFMVYGINALTEYALWNLHYAVLFFLIILPVVFKGMPAMSWHISLPRIIPLTFVIIALGIMVSKANLYYTNALRFAGVSKEQRVQMLSKVASDGLYGKTYQIYLLSMTDLSKGDIEGYDRTTQELMKWRPFESVILWRIQICLEQGKYAEVPALMRLAVVVDPKNRDYIDKLIVQYHLPAVLETSQAL